MSLSETRYGASVTRRHDCRRVDVSPGLSTVGFVGHLKRGEPSFFSHEKKGNQHVYHLFLWAIYNTMDMLVITRG